MFSKLIVKPLQKQLSIKISQSFARNARQQMEDLRKIGQFDQQVKDKYLNNNQDLKGMDINEIKARISEEYEAQNEKLFNSENILSEIRGSMFDNDEMKQQKQTLKNQNMSQQERQMQPMEKYFSNLTDEEFAKRSKEFQNDIQFGRIPDPERRSQSISRDYANYSSFDKNTVVQKDIRNEWEEFPNEIYQGKRILNFINNLEGDVFQKKQIESSMEELRIANPNLNDNEIVKKHFENEAVKIMKEKTYTPNFDLGEGRLEDDIHQFNQPKRLSPIAKEQIFKLYAKGWTVRDISSRFGILPERVKAVVWLRQKYYFEILPHVDLRTIKAGMEKELQYNKEHKYHDYGIDLEELSRRNKGILTPSFKKQKDVDVRKILSQEQRKQDTIESAAKKRRARSQRVTIDFVGSGQRGYYLKEWIINAGRGSDKVSTMFKKAVYYADNQKRLPKKVQQKLHLGPRKASEGFGHI